MSYLEKIIKQSPWLMDHRAIEQDVHLARLKQFPLIHHEQSFLNYNFQDGVYIVTGPRQIGKSTHIKLLIQQKITEGTKNNFLYFNCDLLDKKQDIVAVVEEYLSQFPSHYRRYLCLDEITSVHDSFLAIKYLVDHGYDSNLTYILTGSNTIHIQKTGEYLPGRRGKGIDFNFRPLSFKACVELIFPEVKTQSIHSEKDFIALQQHINLTKTLYVYLKTGGFPRVINEYHMHNAITEDVFAIYRSWLTSEIAKSDKREYLAKMILERCLFSLGHEVSYHAFAQDTGIGSHNTIYDYLNFLESAHVLTVLYHFDIDQKKVNYRKNKKIYFNDPFIHAIIEAWLSGKPKQDYDYLQSPILKSKLIENLVFLKLASCFKNVYFYKGHNEIDFVTNRYCIEVKYQNRIILDDYKYLLTGSMPAILVTKQGFKKNDPVFLCPVEYFLLHDLLIHNINELF